jgi:hypothetical protein
MQVATQLFGLKAKRVEVVLATSLQKKWVCFFSIELNTFINNGVSEERRVSVWVRNKLPKCFIDIDS